MAKVTGALMSMDASGGFASTLVFAKWKGRPYVRQLVTPANPQTLDQQDSRNRVRVVGTAQRWANQSTMHGPSRTVTDKAALQAASPSGQAWNGTLAKAMIGSGFVNYAAAAAAWTALTSPQKAAWDTAAAGLAPAFPATAQQTTGGAPSTAISAGQAFFHYTYGLYTLGIGAAPGATPPVYS